jgi:hypothetical protein
VRLNTAPVHFFIRCPYEFHKLIRNRFSLPGGGARCLDGGWGDVLNRKWVGKRTIELDRYGVAHSRKGTHRITTYTHTYIKHKYGKNNFFAKISEDNSSFTRYVNNPEKPFNELSTNYKILRTYLLTPWSRVIFQKLTGSAASQKFPAFYGTRNFITLLTSARHLSLSWAKSIQSPQPPPTS